MTKQPSIQHLTFETDNGVGARARLGLLVLQSDHTLEEECRLLTALSGVAVYHARLRNDEVITTTTLANMAQELPVAAQLLPPHLDLSALGYGCTSGATVIGEARVAQLLASVHPGVPSSNPITAAKLALRVLGVRKLALLTPYAPEVTEAMRENFTQAGLVVSAIGTFNESNDSVVGKITPDSIFRGIVALAEQGECDGIFVSCTNLRATPVIAQAEQLIQKPITASNHALLWHLLRLSGVHDTIEGMGRLFTMPDCPLVSAL